MTKKTKRRVYTIEIGGQLYKVKHYKRVPKVILKELGSVSGWCDSAKKILGIVEEYADPLTLFHEIGHACADTVRANNALNNEAFARPFFAIFYAALKNAKLLR